MKPFTAEEAREAVLARAVRAGAKGAPGLFPPAAARPKRSLFRQAVAALESEQAIFVDRRRKVPRCFATEHRPALPTTEQVAERLEEIAMEEYPAVATRARWKARLKDRPDEALLLEPALALLLQSERLVRLLCRRGRRMEEVFVPARPPAAEFSPAAVQQAYARLAASTGFPSVAISQLQQESGAPLAALQAWLSAEHASGRAILARGDWSLAGEDKRLAAVLWQGQAHLLVRLMS